jgi:hypothetical protein
VDAEDAGPAPRPRRPSRPPAEVAAELAASLGLPVVLRRKPRTRWAAVGALSFAALLVLAEGAWALSIGDAFGAILCALVGGGLLAGAAAAWRRLSIEATVREDGIAWRGPGLDLEIGYRDIEWLKGGMGVLGVRAWGRELPVPLEGAGVSAGRLQRFIEAKVQAEQPPAKRRAVRRGAKRD